MVRGLTSQKAIYSLSKNSYLYHGLELWCHLYHRDISKMVNLVRETDQFIYFYAKIPLDGKTFSKNVLNNQLGINEHGYATDKFAKYVNRRYKALYTRHLFTAVQNVSALSEDPRTSDDPKYYKKLRIKALMQNMVNNVVTIDFNYDPLEDPNLPFPQPLSKGQILIHYSYQYPYEQIPRTSWLLSLIKIWLHHQHKTLHNTVKGLYIDKNFIYFGMAPIPRKDMWKYRHPNHYSDIDYFVLGGNGDGEAVKSFIKFIRTTDIGNDRSLKNPSKISKVKA